MEIGLLRSEQEDVRRFRSYAVVMNRVKEKQRMLQHSFVSCTLSNSKEICHKISMYCHKLGFQNETHSTILSDAKSPALDDSFSCHDAITSNKVLE